MTANVLPTIFTIEIVDTPTLTFEAQNLREAYELCHEQWLKDDLAEAKSGGVPLWDGKAKLRARIALPDERALFAEAKNNGQPSDGLMLVYLRTGRRRASRRSGRLSAGPNLICRIFNEAIPRRGGIRLAFAFRLRNTSSSSPADDHA